MSTRRVAPSESRTAISVVRFAARATKADPACYRCYATGARLLFATGRLDEVDSGADEARVIGREVVGVQEQKHPAAGLPTHGLLLPLVDRLRQQ